MSKLDDKHSIEEMKRSDKPRKDKKAFNEDWKTRVDLGIRITRRKGGPHHADLPSTR